MTKLNTKIILSLTLTFLTFLLNNCASTTVLNTMRGVPTIIGNEPFTELVLKTQDEEIYYLKCDEEIEAELRKWQGKLYEIKYSEKSENANKKIITVEEIIPIHK